MNAGEKQNDKTEYKDSDYSWIGWIAAIAIAIWIFYGLSASNASQIQSNKEEAISQFVDEIESEYSALSEDAQNLVDDIEQGCEWQYEISDGIGDYCIDSVSEYSNDIQNGNDWDVSDLTYDMADDQNTILDSIAEQSNTAYNDLVEKTYETQATYRNQCDWLADNIYTDMGDECNGYLNGIAIGDYSSDPFRASDYYESE
jgi:hypothetical protein